MKRVRHRISTRRYRGSLRVLALAVLVLAALLRSIGLGFGQGVLTARPDEELLRSGVLIALGGDPNPHYAVWGHLYHDVYAVAAAGMLGLTLVLGKATSWTDALAAWHCEPWTMIALGRAISAVAGVLTLVPTYQLARRASRDRVAALAACLLLATLFLHVRDAHFATSDVALALFATAALASLAQPGRLRAARAGLWTGLALATKLLSVTVVLTFLTVLLGELMWRRIKPAQALRSLLAYAGVAAVVAVVTQPFLVLDPMETWYGLFGDLFNPERQPFAHGVSVQNAKLIVLYYIPQAIGWPIGGLAVIAAMLLVRRVRERPAAALLVYGLWSVAALVSVERIFLRYLDPLLPVACVLAAHALDWLMRPVAVALVRVVTPARSRISGETARKSGAAASLTAQIHGRPRAGALRCLLVAGTTVLVALPNLARCMRLDRLLRRSDTRAEAGRWIAQNLPDNARILWAGYGKIAPHITMPWLQAPAAYDRAHAELRASRALDTAVDEAIARWKERNAAKTFWTVGVAITPNDGSIEASGLAAYPMLDQRYDIPWLERIDRWARQAGWLHRESPRWDLMRRHVTAVLVTSPESLASSDERYVVLTGMPCDPALVRRLRERYDERVMFDPGAPWGDPSSRVMYDAGDAWYVPNQGLECVTRPGPQVRIFERRQ